MVPTTSRPLPRLLDVLLSSLCRSDPVGARLR